MNTGLLSVDSMLYLLFQKKKCKNCKKLSHRDVLYCWCCGCSFNQRICAAGHKNPPWVQHCLTCGKDRSLMSRPHDSEDLSFVRHQNKRFTYVPSRPKLDYVLAVSAICIGSAILCYIVFVIAGIV